MGGTGSGLRCLCRTPDDDGVERELTEGQVTALELFLATLDASGTRIPPEPEFAARW